MKNVIQSETQEELNNTIREYMIKQIKSNYFYSERHAISFFFFFLNVPLQKSIYVQYFISVLLEVIAHMVVLPTPPAVFTLQT